MRHRGVHYDTGTIFRGPGYSIATRRGSLDLSVVRRELQIIRDDLHANAVRVVGSHVDRLISVARLALDLGLEVWLSPSFFEYSASVTAARTVEAARAVAPLGAAYPGRVVIIVGAELTLFMKGLVAGRSVADRLENLRGDPSRLANGRLDEYLASLVPAVRAVFDGPLTYASLLFERVDWTPFDYVGVDHYRDVRTADRYLDVLEPLLATGRPVIVTEFGRRTFAGAESSGALGFGITDSIRLWLHTRPVVGRLVRSRVRAGYQRDEDVQARELDETLAALEQSGVAGALLSTFVTPEARTDDDPRYDLDMDSLSLVASLPTRHHGTAYPDMSWEPKKSFAVVARHFGAP